MRNKGLIRRRLDKTLVVLPLVIVVASPLFLRIEKVALANGLLIGRQYVWDGPNDIYPWTATGEKVAPFAVEVLCFDDHTIHATGFERRAVVYDINRGHILYSDQSDCLSKWRETGLRAPTSGCNGNTDDLSDVNLILWSPQILEDCTLSNPCTLDD